MEPHNSTQDQIRCAGHGGTPELQYPHFCAINIWQAGLNLTEDPLDVLKDCCPTHQYTYFGPDSCFAYCNATEETQPALQQCLMSPQRVRAVMCSGAIGLGSLTSYLVLAMVFTSLWQM